MGERTIPFTGLLVDPLVSERAGSTDWPDRVLQRVGSALPADDGGLVKGAHSGANFLTNF